MADSKKNLFSEFSPVSTEAWMEKITEDLKGADFQKKLVWRTNEGFQVQPFYRLEDLQGLETTDSLPGNYPYVRGTKTDNHWLIREDIEVNDSCEANNKALLALKKGADSLCFNIHKKEFDAKDMETLLKGICPECVEINFRCCIKKSVHVLQLFVENLQAHQCDLSKVKGSVIYNPFKKMFVKGMDIPAEWMETASELMALAKDMPNFCVLSAEPYLFNNAGCYIAQELGFGLAYGNAYLEAFSEAGKSAHQAARKMAFNFGISSNYFMEIAKFRAARMLWAKIVAAYPCDCEEDDSCCENEKCECGSCLCGTKMRTHAYTSEWNQTTYDMYVNLLRSQTEAMSATIAGVDSLTVVPFDKAFKTPDEFSERIARNQQLLLREEAGFAKVVDPAAGSYYLENLTASIAEEAWKYFLTIQEKGGFYAALKEGYIQDEVNASAQKRFGFIAQRREILLGTNQFPNFNEMAAEKIDTKEDDSCPCRCKHEKTVKTIDFTRGAEQFETLRLTTERSGKRPKVFMLTIGSLSMRLARAQFSGNFFACAGYQIIDNLGFKTPEEGVAAARKANADIIVICSSDDEYAELAPATLKAIGDGKEIFVVAGAPACMEELKAAGIQHFIHVRSNVLETLQGFNKMLNL